MTLAEIPADDLHFVDRLVVAVRPWASGKWLQVHFDGGASMDYPVDGVWKPALGQFLRFYHVPGDGRVSPIRGIVVNETVLFYTPL